jgi:hypothetical protein
MTNEQQQRIVKAASAGFAQSLINEGYSPDVAAQLTTAYANPVDGMLTKRAAAKQLAAAGVLDALAVLRAARR